MAQPIIPENEDPSATPPGRPGARVGQVAEFTLIARFKPGGADQLRAVLQRTAPRLEEAANRVGTLHDMRWVIFDDDTRVLFATTYDGDWDAYIDDFATKLGEPLDTHFAMVEGYPGVASPQIKDWIARHQITADGWFCAYPDATVRQIWKGQQVLQAFEALLDTAAS